MFLSFPRISFTFFLRKFSLFLFLLSLTVYISSRSPTCVFPIDATLKVRRPAGAHALPRMAARCGSPRQHFQPQNQQRFGRCHPVDPQPPRRDPPVRGRPDGPRGSLRLALSAGPRMRWRVGGPGAAAGGESKSSGQSSGSARGKKVCTGCARALASGASSLGHLGGARSGVLSTSAQSRGKEKEKELQLCALCDRFLMS